MQRFLSIPRIIDLSKKGFKRLTFLSGILGFLFVFLAFTDIPYYAYFHLGMTDLRDGQNLEHIVIMGGDGMPSPSGLIRVYYGAELALENPKAKVYIALPYNENQELKQLELFKKELILKGIHEDRIQFEPLGHNTYSQAQNLAQTIPDKSLKTCIVSSPEHMYRSISCFRKQGFSHLTSMPTFEVPSDEEQLKNKSSPEERKVRNLSLRYNMWSYMGYEIKVMREYAAIAYYWSKGWI